ncbi:hypothetical protein BDN72DRAFT_949374 [Pluteus cervinus]|uniref:Uncharacterized protein n=1 Tax=Pluteus cervinus TaxID=181527 RepID=A0ACD3ASV6_9AGAR|nr:hypothetical protein BDN72DRAFT_949374 [Pluteus cervinus]
MFYHKGLFFHNLQLTAAVTLDQHSLLLDGKRLMVFSSKFHPFRLPSPGLWQDILEKLKASGFNAVSVYWHWGFSAPNPHEIRFTEHSDLAKFYSVAKDVGVLVIVRPGLFFPKGGIPRWATTMAGRARTNAMDYRAAFTRHHIFGTVQSESEYATTREARITGLDNHMQDVMDTLRSSGISRVPIIHNDKGPNGQFALQGPGKVDLDRYPLGFDCNNPSKWNELTTQLDTYHQQWNPAEPLALFEWQGGAFSYWSGPSYMKCYQLINEQFANNNYASAADIQNLYMSYGGTNWGNMHTHTIYSSYESLTPKLDELKLQGYFLHSSPSYLDVGRIGNGTVGSGTTSPAIYTTHLHAPSTNTSFYFVRQLSNQNQDSVKFKLTTNTTGSSANGDIELAGRESKILVTGDLFGKSRLSYSTAEIMTWSTIDDVDTIVLYALKGQYVEAVLETSTDIGDAITIKGSTSSTTKVTKANNRVITFNSATRVILADKQTAAGFWAPRIQNKYSNTFGHDHYDLSPSVPSVLIHGPYLVRGAADAGDTLELKGDLNSTTTIDIYAPSRFKSFTWNGIPLSLTKSDTGSLQGTIAFPDPLSDVAVSAKIPKLDTLEWRCADSLPEVGASDFDDTNSHWVLANKTTTNRPFKPSAGKYILYSSEYGFRSGHFAGNASGVKLAIQGGSSCYSVFMNSYFLGYGQGTSNGQDGTDLLERTFNFTSAQLNYDENGYTLISNHGNDFVEWHVAGSIGGENTPDHVRGPYNEGGWWFERVDMRRLTRFALDNTTPHRVLIYVNGWQFGKFVSTHGPQTSFPIPEGILDHRVENHVSIVLWALATSARCKAIQTQQTRYHLDSGRVNEGPAPRVIE